MRACVCLQTLHGNLARAEALHADATARHDAELLHRVDDLETERKHNKVLIGRVLDTFRTEVYPLLFQPDVLCLL